MIQKVFLSRRNLEALLSKLDRKAAGQETACTITKYKNKVDEPYVQTMESIDVVAVEGESIGLQTMAQIEVHAVEDIELYRNRPAGAMHPADETELRHFTGIR